VSVKDPDFRLRMAGALDSLDAGVMAFRSVRDGSGWIIDFEWTLVNTAGERLTHRTSGELIGRRLLEEMPGNRTEGLFSRYVRVVETGEPAVFDVDYSHDGIDAVFSVKAVRALDGFVVSFYDVTRYVRGG